MVVWSTAGGRVHRIGGLSRPRRGSRPVLLDQAVRELFPSVQVLARARLTYDRDPFAGYGSSARRPWRRIFARGGWLPPMERVVALDVAEGWAVPFGALREKGVANTSVERVPVVVFWAEGPGDASGMGQTAVYDRRVAGRTLTFRAVGAEFHDRQIRTRWNLAGRATTGPLKGRRLSPVPHDTPFWFAWTLFRPETRLWRP